jgi:enterochelin esterase family protein
MGGGQTVMGLNNLDNFAWFGSFSGAFNNWAQTIPFAKPPAPPEVAAAAEKAIAAAKIAQAEWQAATQQAAEARAAATAASAAPTANNTPAGGRGGGRGGDPTRGAGSGPMFDARLPLLFPNLDARTNSRIKLLWIGIGTNDTLLGVNRQFRQFLNTRGIKHTYVEFPNEGHVWPLWRRNFAEFAQLILK